MTVSVSVSVVVTVRVVVTTVGALVWVTVKGPLPNAGTSWKISWRLFFCLGMIRRRLVEETSDRLPLDGRVGQGLRVAFVQGAVLVVVLLTTVSLGLTMVRVFVNVVVVVTVVGEMVMVVELVTAGLVTVLCGEVDVDVKVVVVVTVSVSVLVTVAVVVPPSTVVVA